MDRKQLAKDIAQIYSKMDDIEKKVKTLVDKSFVKENVRHF